MTTATPTAAHDILTQLSTQLRQRRDELANQLGQRLHPANGQLEMALANNYMLELDRAEASQLNETDLALLRHELDELRAVDGALARLRDGTYGNCSQCGEAIAVARLLAQPSATMCVSCQSNCEHMGGAAHRLHGRTA